MCIFVAFIVVNRRLLFFSCLSFRPARCLRPFPSNCSDGDERTLVTCSLSFASLNRGLEFPLLFLHLLPWFLRGTCCEIDIWQICRVSVVVLPSTHYLPRGNWTHVEYIMLLCSPDNSILDNIKQIHQQRRGCWTKMTFWSFYALFGHFVPC